MSKTTKTTKKTTNKSKTTKAKPMKKGGKKTTKAKPTKKRATKAKAKPSPKKKTATVKKSPALALNKTAATSRKTKVFVAQPELSVFEKKPIEHKGGRVVTIGAPRNGASLPMTENKLGVSAEREASIDDNAIVGGAAVRKHYKGANMKQPPVHAIGHGKLTKPA